MGKKERLNGVILLVGTPDGVADATNHAPHSAPALVHEAPPPAAHARRRAPKPADSHTYTSNRPSDLHSTRHLQASLGGPHHGTGSGRTKAKARQGHSDEEGPLLPANEEGT